MAAVAFREFVPTLLREQTTRQIGKIVNNVQQCSTIPSALTSTGASYCTLRHENGGNSSSSSPPQLLKESMKGLVIPAERLTANRHTTHATFHRQQRRSSSRISAVAVTPAGTKNLSWQQIAGADNWAGLVETPPPTGGKVSAPSDPQFVKELVKYGLLCQATMDGFIGEGEKPEYNNKYGGQNMYTRAELLKASLPKGNPFVGSDEYVITKYLHSTSGFQGLLCDRASKLFATLAQRTDRRVFAGYICHKVVGPEDASGKAEIEIVAVFRGTRLISEWISNLDVKQRPWLGPGKALVHDGFQQIYRDDPMIKTESDSFFSRFVRDALPSAEGSPQAEVHESILELAGKYRIRNITCIGHSLGAALATVCSLDVGQFLKEDPAAKKAFASYAALPPVTGFAYASPRVGNGELSDLFKTYGVKLLRVTEMTDVITMVPGALSKDEENALKTASYKKLLDALKKLTVSQSWVKVGEELKLSYLDCPIFRRPVGDDSDIWRFHNLGGYGYLMATQLGGQKQPVKGVVPGPGEGYDYRLCNKTGDLLNDDLSKNAKPEVKVNWLDLEPDFGKKIPSPSVQDS